MKKILVTAFDPFGGEAINPALEAVKRLPSMIGNTEIIWCEVPTVFYKSATVVQQVIEKEKPDAVLCIGQAGGRTAITLERVAINIDDARIPDNDGQQPIDTRIQQAGESAYFSTVPIKRIVQALRQQGIPAQVSNTAGTYVCNHLMYQVLYMAQTIEHEFLAGFMHIPYLPEQAVKFPQQPSMAKETIIQAIEIALATIAENKEDIALVGGAEH